jgi:hypothetical protein
MLVWLFALVTLLLVTPLLFASAHLAKRISRQQCQGFLLHRESLNANLRYSSATIRRVGKRGRPALETLPPARTVTGPNR